MALGNFEVGRIVRRGDLDRACAEFRIDHVVADDHPDPVHVRNAHVHAHQVAIARVVRMYRHANVAEDRLGPSRRHRDPGVLAFDERVAHIRQLALDFLVFDFEV